MAIAFIDSKGQPNADSFYQKFRLEPVLPAGNIQIDLRKLLPEMTVQELLETITKEVKKMKQDILLVSHGTSEGLDILIHKNSKAKLEKNALEVLRKYEKGILDAERAASMLYFAKLDFLRFWDLIKAVRKLNLNRVELRSCLVGGSEDALNMLKAFFGSSSCSAPKDLDVFGTINPGTPGPLAIPALMKKFPRAKITGTPPHRFALHVSMITNFHAAADSQKGINNWVSTHLPGTSILVKGQFPVHGIAPSHGAEKMIWAGEKAYRKLLAKV